MGNQKFCDHCGFYKQRSDGSPAVLRYTLRRETDQTRANGQRTKRYQVSAGGIDLCDDCWTELCKPRMNPRKSHRRTA